MNKERMLKILELAKRGIGGEAKVAQTMLEEMLAKNNMTVEELEKSEDINKIYNFIAKKDIEINLLYNIVYKIFGDNIPFFYSRWSFSRYEIEVSLSKSDYLIIDYLYDIYVRNFRMELENLYTNIEKEKKEIEKKFLNYEKKVEKQRKNLNFLKKHGLDVTLQRKEISRKFRKYIKNMQKKKEALEHSSDREHILFHAFISKNEIYPSSDLINTSKKNKYREERLTSSYWKSFNKVKDGLEKIEINEAIVNNRFELEYKKV